MADMSPDERVAHWRAVIGRWRDSEMSGAAFCRQGGLREWRFRYWIKRIAELDAPEGGFARVSTPGSGLRLVLPGGLRLEVEPDFDGTTLKRFLGVLASPC